MHLSNESLTFHTYKFHALISANLQKEKYLTLRLQLHQTKQHRQESWGRAL